MKNAYRTITLAVLAYMICCGAALVLFPGKPFWRDEWCLLYNVKFSSHNQLLGPLKFTQQFPRVYLQLIKWFTSAFNYSYLSTRLPSYVVGTLGIALAYSIKDRLFAGRAAGYLFVLFIAANPMFIDYYVQIKHYEMEILMSIVAVWQLTEVLEMKDVSSPRPVKYVLLCGSFFAAPFFSYTYPIAVAPVLLIMGVMCVRGHALTGKLLKWMIPPMMAAVAGIVLFYMVDVSRVLHDKDMYGFLVGYLMNSSNSWLIIISRIWQFFAKMGAGLVFEIVFGITALYAWVYAIVSAARQFSKGEAGRQTLLICYGASVPLLIIALFLAGKIPLGQAKFTAFAAPAFGILIPSLLEEVRRRAYAERLRKYLFPILFAALAGNIITAFLQPLLDEQTKKRLAIYAATEAAIKLAKEKHLPLLITPGIGYPDDITIQIEHLSMPDAAGIVKTFPSYSVHDTITVYTISNLEEASKYKTLLPPGKNKVLAGDGLIYKELSF
jgi:hypothetical protein